MTSPASNYKYLLVELHVARENRQLFEKLMAEMVREVFEKKPDPDVLHDPKLNWRLRASLQTDEVDETDSSEFDLVQYLHLWEVPLDIDVTSAMVILGKDSRFYKLNLLNVLERQDLYTAAITYAPMDDDNAPRGRFELESEAGEPMIVETADAPADWFKLHQWQEAMPQIAADVAEERNLRLAFALQSETGRLRRYINFWRPMSARTPTADQARKVITRKPVQIVQVKSGKNAEDDSANTDDVTYTEIPYDNLVTSNFRVYKEVSYR